MNRSKAFNAPLATTLGLIGAVCLIIGLALSWAELATAGVTVLAALAICLLFLIGIPAPQVSTSVARTRVSLGEPTVVSVRARSRIPLLSSRVELPVTDGSGRTIAVHSVRGRRRRATRQIPVSTDRRGVLTIGPARILRRDPIGIFSSETLLTEPTQVIVHPHTTLLDPVTAGFLRDMDGDPTGRISDSTVAFHGLRDYIPGDDPRSVHWRSTARTGRLTVREHEETRRWHLAVGLSTADEYASSAEFELAVSVAASLGVHALTYGRELTVVTNDRRLSALSRNPLLDEFASVERTNRPTTVVDLARDVAKASFRASIITIITGSKVTPSQLKVARSRLPSGVTTFVLRVRTGARAGRRQVGDIPVISIGKLDHLSRAIRSLAPGSQS
ncbi:DUF58 domain-containing protein [Smaragdicoccus niigatensis]|uniref:DUF58 domain-containing protein n=1 Tax=Smaragdicoccus niigatensis TaxID=359359 RepID=UPI0003750022|nr:DUF58 domain-containing protein [Smaragdicoccus niigatensis]